MLLEEFGRPCWVLQQDGKCGKLDPKSRKFIFVGIADGTKGYRYYNTETKNILTSRNVIFSNEGEYEGGQDLGSHMLQLEGEIAPGNQQAASDSTDSTAGTNRSADTQTFPDAEVPSQTTSQIPISTQQSARIAIQPLINYQLLHNPAARGLSNQRHDTPTPEKSGHISIDYAMIGRSLENEPLTYKDAQIRPDWPKWKVAMDDEI